MAERRWKTLSTVFQIAKHFSSGRDVLLGTHNNRNLFNLIAFVVSILSHIYLIRTMAIDAIAIVHCTHRNINRLSCACDTLIFFQLFYPVLLLLLLLLMLLFVVNNLQNRSLAIFSLFCRRCYYYFGNIFESILNLTFTFNLTYVFQFV